MNEIAIKHGTAMAKAMGSEFVKEMIVNYLRKVAEERAKLINNETRKKIQKAIDEAEEDEDIPEACQHEIDKRAGVDALLVGSMLAKTVAGWSTEEAVRQAEDQGKKKQVWKEWVTGASARSSHAAMDGERVLIDETFSNGAFWPGDDSLDPDESCGCNCTTRVIVITE